MSERSAILLAGAAHLALLAALSLSWAMTAKTLPSFEEMAPVEVVQIDDVPKVTEAPKPSMPAAPQETQAAAAPEVTPEPKPAPPPPEPPKPEPPKAVSDVPAPRGEARAEAGHQDSREARAGRQARSEEGVAEAARHADARQSAGQEAAEGRRQAARHVEVRGHH